MSRQELRELIEKANVVLRPPNGCCGTVALILPWVRDGAAGTEMTI